MSKRTPKYILDETENDHLIDFKKETKLTPKQKEAVKLITSNDITILTGPAGTAKTFCAAYAALKLFSREDQYHKIIITKPTEIISDAELGFMPGTMEEKLAHYMENFNDVFEDILEAESIKQMVSAKEITFKAAQYVRGRTLKNSIIIVDEFQSFDIKTLMALATRLGKNGAKMIFCGDIKQNDIHKKYVAVDIFKEILDGLPGIGMLEFTREDNMRHPLVQMMVDRFEALEAAGRIPQNKKNA